MKSIIYCAVILWSFCNSLKYCDIEKAFCNEHNHVACFNELDLPGIYVGNQPQTCIKDLIDEINLKRTRSGLIMLNRNQELETLATLTLGYTPVTCGISMKYRDMKLFFAKKDTLINATVTYRFYPDVHVIDNENATDIGCACKTIRSFIYCWYNYTKRSTVTEYHRYLNDSFMLKCNLIQYILIVLAIIILY